MIKDFSIRFEQNDISSLSRKATIDFELNSALSLSVIIYNQHGELIDEIANQKFEAGRHSIVWGIINYSPGLYYCEFVSGLFRFVKHLNLL
jgi:hypothetical protein